MPKFPFQSLINWSKIHGRYSLPWRQYFTLSPKDLGYHVWLSEILLQQTQVDRVVEYYDTILKNFPTVESLASTSYETFFPYYQGLGYYSRARNMLQAAKIVVELHSGIFPNDTEKLIQLPGVGPYTAAAIRAFVYNEPVLSFDTNLEKIFSRFYHGTRFQKLSRIEKTQIEKDFKSTSISAREMNAAFMDFGSLISLNTKPSSPDEWQKISENYPFPHCLWMQTQGQHEIQEIKKRVVFPTQDASIRVVLHENHQIYYSSEKSEYQPFVLPPTEGNIRHYIQEHFRKKFGLELSVRPVHDKYFENDAPFVVCNAQIQKGQSSFVEYRKENGIFVKNT